MPELPEVETITRQLRDVLVGRKVAAVSVLRSKSFGGDTADLVGKTIKDIRRKAKMLWFEFEESELIAMVHLKMTGQLIYVDGGKRIAGGHPTSDWVNTLPSKHTRIVIKFEDDSNLFFNDLRVFGWFRLAEKEALSKMVMKMPPDVVDPEFTLGFFADKIRSLGRPIKIVLLDSTVLGGVGNIYANDALFLAGIDPRRKAKGLKENEVEKLYLAIIEVINLGIKHGGASASNYVDATGMGGSYQKYFLTYKQDGKPCRNCGTIVQKIKLGGRGTFFCPNCQS